MTDQAIRIDSRFNRIAAVIVWSLAALAVVTAVWSADVRLAWVYAAAPLAALLGWAALWRPSVTVSATGVRLENVSHDVDVPWEALVHVDTKRALTLHTPSGAFTAWSAPAPGLFSTMMGNAKARREARAAGGAVLGSDRLGTDSGNAALVVRETWRRRLDAGQVELGVADETPVTRRWHVALLTACAVLAAASIALIIATG
ncbi:PH domain-containing protein [Microbacterium timonense]|uniref:PH domain-containing protein n=1 Tax=Microbacterium timonense TaxID=2086576 RepID=UPI000D0F9411|nr:PH domain-containing protein [Microbacterium timonense]